MARAWGTVLLLLVVWAPPAEAQQAAAAAAPEVRALWVDAFHAGIRSPGEADALVEAAVRARLNTLFVQVRRRGDVLFPGSIDPPLDDPAFDPAYDALAAIIDKGHAAGLQVHAWINAAPVWRDEAPPKAESHIFNRHGLTAEGDASWLTRMRDGSQKFIVGYFLDLGHPGAADYLAGVYLDVARRYKVDGLHFDYIRYPETEPPLPRGADVGYNPVSLARFGRVHGRTDLPAPDDEAWSAWRRTQVSNFVRRVSLECREVNPTLQVSAATIAWGKPPLTRADFINVAPMQRIFQDWLGWLDAGWLDTAVPMNYAREQDPVVRGWFDGWIAWEKRERRDRHLVVGLGAYLNTQDDVLAQVERVRQRQGRDTVNGVSFFCVLPSAPGARGRTRRPDVDGLPDEGHRRPRRGVHRPGASAVPPVAGAARQGIPPRSRVRRERRAPRHGDRHRAPTRLVPARVPERHGRQRLLRPRTARAGSLPRAVRRDDWPVRRGQRDNHGGAREPGGSTAYGVRRTAGVRPEDGSPR